ncbi:hypothetical protein HPB48_020609 [Haemaphysalis longicornis]|uniref:Uncharacterized protein n=1 Tax=Haemaphysalis longicornis TaxID=44386 RepID=A0A9J6GK35_HAELO|nr:hypothetical protein HPB48_020609 [Haemaphysalis longicornis]
MSSLERQSSVSSQGCPFCNEAKTAATQNQQLLKAAQDDLKATQNELLRVKMELRKAEELEEELKAAKLKVLQITRELELMKEVADTLRKKAGTQFSIERFKHSDEDVRFYTGLPSYTVFQFLVMFLQPWLTTGECENLVHTSFRPTKSRQTKESHSGK